MICKLSDQALIRVRGNDAKKFLQGQLTCDVEKKISMGAHCNPQGRVISLFYLFQQDNDYYLLMQKSMISHAVSTLKKYAVFFKVEMNEMSDEWQIVGIENPDENIIQNNICIPVKNSRYIVVGKDLNLQITESLEHWKTLNIRDGIPEIYPETSGKFLPHEINLHELNALSFEKGCYTGQEIIARMHYRGKLKNHLYVASVSSEYSPAPSADIYSLQGSEFKPAGMLVDTSREVYNHQYDVLIVAGEFDNKINSLYLMQNTGSILQVQNVR